MRLAELLMAIALAIFSAYVMWKSAELPIGWIPEEGPGGGAWPFWLAAIMLVCCLVIIARWILGTSAFSQSDDHFMSPEATTQVALIAGALIVTVALFYVIGVYGALPLFLIFYIRFLGHHSWPTSLGVALLTPVVTFLFFEIALKITLPKGYTEPAFYPLYKLLL